MVKRWKERISLRHGMMKFMLAVALTAIMSVALGMDAYADANYIDAVEIGGRTTWGTANASTTYVVTTSQQINNVVVSSGATVYLDIKKGVTLTVRGNNAGSGSGRTGGVGANPGIYLPSNAKLVVMGEGTLIAYGGNAGNGARGSNGTNAYDSGDYIYSGTSGAGGGGGGGAAAGIGGYGGAGGTGGYGVGGVSKKVATHNDDGYNNNRNAGGSGSRGGTGTSSYGKLVVLGKATVKAYGGAQGYGGGAGSTGAFKRNKKGAGATRHDREGFAAGGAGGGGGAGGTAAPGYGCGGTGGAGGGGGGGSAVYKNDDGDSSHGDLVGGGGRGGVACSGYSNGGASNGERQSGHGGASGGSSAGTIATTVNTASRDTLATFTISGASHGRGNVNAYQNLTDTSQVLKINLIDKNDNAGLDKEGYGGTHNIKNSAGTGGIFSISQGRAYVGYAKPITTMTATSLSDSGISLSQDIKKPGYVLDGWYTAAVGGMKVLNADGSIYQDVENYTFNKRWNTSNANLYAHWTRVSRTLKFDYQGGRVGTSTSSTLPVYVGEGLPVAGQNGYFANVSRTGYRLIGYSTEKGSTDPSTFVYETEARNYTRYIVDENGQIKYVGSPYVNHLGSELKLVDNTSLSINECTPEKEYKETVEGNVVSYKKGYTSKVNPWNYTGADNKYSNITPNFTAVYPSETQDLTLYAVWEPIEYNIEYWSEDEDEQSVYLGSDFNVPYTELELRSIDDFGAKAQRNHYTFKGWNVFLGQNWSMYPAGKVYKTGLTTQDHDTVQVYASWEIFDNFDVNYNGNGGRGVPPTGSLFKGDKYIVADRIPIREDYTFVGWCFDPDGSSTVYKPGDPIEGIEETVTLYAIWEMNPYVVYHANGGTFDVAPEKQYYPKSVAEDQSDWPVIGKVGGENIEPSRAGYIFKGWNTNSTQASNGEVQYVAGAKHKIEGNTTFYAVWEKMSYDVTATGVEGEEFATFYTYFDDTKDYVAFNRRVVEPEGTVGEGETTPPKQIIYTAQYKDGDESKDYKVKDKESIQIAVFVDEKYDSSKMNFYVDGMLTGCRNRVQKKDDSGKVLGTYYMFNIGNVQDSITMWVDGITEIQYSVDLDTAGGNITVAEGQEIVTAYTYKANNLLIALPTGSNISKEGYIFLGWKQEGKDQYKTHITEDDKGDIDLVAEWEPIKYNVQYIDGFDVHKNESNIKYGDQLQMPALENTDKKTFIGWSVRDTDSNVPKNDGKADYIGYQYVSNMTNVNGRTVVLDAVWDAPKYNLTYSANGGVFVKESDEGQVVLSSYTQTADVDTQVTIKNDDGSYIVPGGYTLSRKGYTFDGWLSKNGDEYENADSVIILGNDVTVYANWKIENHNIKYYGNNVDKSDNWTVNVVDSNDESNNEYWQIESDGFTATATRTRTYGISGELTVPSENSSANAVFGTALYNPVVIDGGAQTAIRHNEGDFYRVTETQTLTVEITEMDDPTEEEPNWEDATTTYNYHYFLGWAKTEEASVPDYRVGEEITVEDNTLLYAVWSDEDAKFIAFNANGGLFGDKTTSIVAITEDGYTTPQSPTRSGYNFVGWATTSNANTPDESETYSDSVTLYAVWSPIEIKVIYHSNNKYTETEVESTEGVKTVVITASDWDTKEKTIKVDEKADSNILLGADSFDYIEVPDADKAELNKLTLKSWVDSINDDGTASSGSKNYMPGGIIFVPGAYIGQMTTENEGSYEIHLYGIYENDVKTHYILYDNNGGHYGPGLASVDEGDSYTFNVDPDEMPTKEGYDFLGWSEDEEAEEPDEGLEVGATDPKKITVDSNSPAVSYVHAVWKEKTFVTVTYQDDDENVLRTEKYYAGERATVQFGRRPIKVGNTFLGWENKATGDKYLEEVFVPEEEQIESQAEGNLTAPDNSIELTENVVLVPVWKTHSYTIDYRTEYNSDAFYQEQKIPYGANYTLASLDKIADAAKEDNIDVENKDSFKPQDGYTFTGWSLIEGGTVDFRMTPEAFEVDGGMTSVDNQIISLYAVYEPTKTQFVLNDDNADHTKELPDMHSFSMEVEYNDSMPNVKTAVGEGFEIPTKYGYDFAGYYDDNNVQYYDADLLTKVAINKCTDEVVTLKAKWTPQEYTINYVYNGTTVGSQKVKYGDQIKVYAKYQTTIEINPDTETLAGWSEEKNSQDTTVPFVPEASVDLRYSADLNKAPLYKDGKTVTLYAIVLNTAKLAVQYDANGGYRQPVDRNIYMTGDTVTVLEAQPLRVGYAFLGWSESPEAAEPQYIAGMTFGMTANTTLYAVWKENKYKIHYIVDGEEKKCDEVGYAQDGYQFLNGAQFSKELNPFVGWSLIENGPVAYVSDQTLANPLSGENDANVKVYAVYKYAEEDVPKTNNNYYVQYFIDGEQVAENYVNYADKNYRFLDGSEYNKKSNPFAGWSYTEGGAVAFVSNQNIVSPLTEVDEDTVKLYGVFRYLDGDEPKTNNVYQICYNLDDALVRTDDMLYSQEGYTFMDGSIYSDDDRIFAGWSINKGGVVCFVANQPMMSPLTGKDGDVVNLYAVFKPVEKPSVITTKYLDREFEKKSEETSAYDNSVYASLYLKATGKKNSVKLSWKKVPNAERYVIYGAKEGEALTQIAVRTRKELSYTVKDLQPNEYYKFLVVGTISINSDHAINTMSPIIHATPSNSSGMGNTTKLTAKKKSYSLVLGDSVATQITVKSSTKKPLTQQTAELRYESLNPSIATVDSTGTILAVAPGKTTIYAYAQDGRRLAIKVKVNKPKLQ